MLCVSRDDRSYFGAIQVALVVNNMPANEGDARDMVSIPELERSPGGGNGSPFQYSCLEHPVEGLWEPGGLQFIGSQRVRRE